MSQLAAAPLRTAKQLQKLKEIKKVKAAIRWHERARKKRQAIAKDRHESKSTAISLQAWTKENAHDIEKRALRNAREDWFLGPLRPNRAIGSGAGRYGAMEAEELRRPAIPVRVQKNRNEVREKKGLQLEYPFVVDDKKYFHIVQDDRVVLMKGREKGKIGVVDSISEESHEAIVKDLNKHYADGSAFNVPPGQEAPAKRETEIMVPLSDLRLVVPYRIATYNAEGEAKHIYEDVVVDHLVMERHTTGIDPFTGLDYGNEEFPKEHRYDPDTGLPIFNRYIAGTRRRIAWPWEKEEKEEPESDRKDTTTTEVKQGWFRSSFRNLGANWVKVKESLRRYAASPLTGGAQKKLEDNDELQAEDEKEMNSINKQIEEVYTARKEGKPQPDKRPPDFDEDTGRNRIEGEETKTFYPTLVYPPFPNELSQELAPHIREAKWAEAREKRERVAQETREIEKPKANPEEQEAKQRQLDRMKTPLQLRWEVEWARKAQAEMANPKVSTEVLLAALGKHMQDNGVKLTEKRRKAAKKLEEVD